MSDDDATWTGHRDELFERVVQRGRARKRRRALTAVSVVVIVGAVAAFGLYSPARGHDTLRVARDPNQTTTSTDPFAGRAIPSSGFVVADDAKSAGPQGPTSFSMELFDEAGHSLGALPRAAIDNAALNASQHVLVVNDSGLHLEAKPFEEGAGLPSGCMQTESDQELAVALCGTGSGINLLGQRIIVNHGKGWTQIIGLPPVQGGSPLVGHWAWASPSPNGQWVLGGWSAECEVPMGLFVSPADGAVHAVTGEAGTAWRDAPESETFGWAPDGSAIVVFGGSSECGGSAPVRRGVYLVAPDTGSRQLLIPLTSSQLVLRWTAVVDQRTPSTTTTTPPA